MTYEEYIDLILRTHGKELVELADDVYTMRTAGYGLSLAEYLYHTVVR